MRWICSFGGMKPAIFPVRREGALVWRPAGRKLVESVEINHGAASGFALEAVSQEAIS